jgi:transposase
MDHKRIGRPKPELILTPEQREQLEGYRREHEVSPALALRAQIVLRCAEGWNNEEVAAAFNVRGVTVGKWRLRFIRLGVDGLRDAPRTNAHRKLSQEKIAAVVRLALETSPAGRKNWSTRAMAGLAGVSQSSVSRVWRAYQVRPHLRSSSVSAMSEPTQR